MDIENDSSPRRLPMRYTIKGSKVSVDESRYKDYVPEFFSFFYGFLEKHVGMGVNRIQREFHVSCRKKYPHLKYIFDYTPEQYLMHEIGGKDYYYRYSRYYLENGILVKRTYSWRKKDKVYTEKVASDYCTFNKAYVLANPKAKEILISKLGTRLYDRLMTDEKIPYSMYLSIINMPVKWHVDDALREAKLPRLTGGWDSPSLGELFTREMVVVKKMDKNSKEYKRMISERTKKSKRFYAAEAKSREEKRSTLLKEIEAERKERQKANDEKESKVSRRQVEEGCQEEARKQSA